MSAGFTYRVPADWPDGKPYPGDDALVDEICPLDCRRLWAAMLLQEISLATRAMRGSGSVGKSDLDIDYARRWIGTRDFYFVCSLVGLEGSAVLARIEPQIKALEKVGL